MSDSAKDDSDQAGVCPLGSAIRELRTLNEPVPRPMRLPTTDEVDAAQRRLGLTFHEDYRRFLLEASDVTFGILEPCTIVPGEGGGYGDLVNVATEAWDDIGVPRNPLPICEDNGDYYCMNDEGRVRFWSHNGSTDESWSSLADWIKQVWIDEFREYEK